MISKTLKTITFEDIQLQATYYPTKTEEKGIILYFHGGGLVFGQREDLPETYLEMFNQAGYSLLAFDYPLAPETKIQDILAISQQQVEWYLNEGQEQLDSHPEAIFLMGRSAGAYLALYLSKHLDIKIKGVIALYGYYNLNDASFRLPNRQMLQQAKVPERMVTQLIQNQPVVDAPIEVRYPIYLSARQNATWMDYLLEEGQEAKDFSLTQEDLSDLPPTFISAAEEDPDVPSRQSKMMAKHIPNNQLVMIDSDSHDFDRTEEATNGKEVYQQMIAWMDEL